MSYLPRHYVSSDGDPSIERAVNRLTLGQIQSLNLTPFVSHFAETEVSASVLQWIN